MPLFWPPGAVFWPPEILPEMPSLGSVTLSWLRRRLCRRKMPLPSPENSVGKGFKLILFSVEFPGTSSSLRVVQIAAAAWG